MKLLFITPMKTETLRRSRQLFLEPDFSKLFARAVSNEGRLVGGLPTKNCFFCLNRTHWHLPLLTFSRTWHTSTAIRETKFFMFNIFLDILIISHFYNIRDAYSRAERSLTNSWWCNSFCTKPSHLCILDCFPSEHDFLPTRIKIGYHGASLYTNCFSGLRLRVVSNSICGSNVSVQHADSGLREEVSLCEWRMTHNILNTCYRPIHLLMINSNPFEKHSEDGMQLWRPLDTNAVNWNTCKQHMCEIMRRPRWFRNTMILTLCKFHRERQPGWLQNAKMLLIGSRNLLLLTSTCRCLRTIEWNSAFAG